jgi:hypothetical protein
LECGEVGRGGFEEGVEFFDGEVEFVEDVLADADGFGFLLWGHGLSVTGSERYRPRGDGGLAFPALSIAACEPPPSLRSQVRPRSGPAGASPGWRRGMKLAREPGRSAWQLQRFG